MKAMSILCAMAFALFAGGCADPIEQTTTEDVKGQFQRGISGQGHLTPSEATNNPTGVPAGSQTPPEYPPR
jgi:hypothetical protein